MAVDISELMLHDIALVHPEASVQDAARAIAESDCRVALIGELEAVEGVLTEHDILIRVVAAGLGPAETEVRAVMSADLFTCRDDQSAEGALEEMIEHRVNQLPVLDRAGRLVGLLTQEAAQRGAGQAGEPHGPTRSAGGTEPPA